MVLGRFPRAALVSIVLLVAGLSCPAAGTGGSGAVGMRVIRNEKAVAVEAGTWLDLVVTRPVATPEQLRYAWPGAPSIEGEAVRFVRLRIEGPPPDVDGGVTTHHYELEAVAPGTARVVLAPHLAGREAGQPPVVVDVTVRAAVPGPSTLADLVVRLAETVASPSATPLAIARTFGEIESDSEGGVYVKPSDPRLARVIVVKRHASGELNDVKLRLAVPGALAAAELERLWGPPTRPPLLAIGETKLVFHPRAPEGARFRAVVSLTFEGDEAGPVAWVDVIRDAP